MLHFARTDSNLARAGVDMESTDTATQQRQFPCRQCGAKLEFAPGTTALKCPYCGAENQIDLPAAPVVERDFLAELRRLADSAPGVETLTVKCTACGAESTLGENTTAGLCAFCGSSIVATASSRKLIKPHCLLPFYITRDQGMDRFRGWARSRWFAPNDLAKFAESQGLKGIYLPCWTYDSETESYYTGQRGDDYWETETYTTTENGKTVTRTRQVRKTRWTFVSGHVQNSFDDVLVIASESLPRKYVERLEPWDLKNFVSYSDEYLAGFAAESYHVELDQGFERAKQIMDGPIRQSICRDIGGDHQRISTVDTSYYDITFKHGLLPVWISAYRYRDRVFRFLVNARTGEVQGERPYSVIKIILFVLMIIAILVIVLIAANKGG